MWTENPFAADDGQRQISHHVSQRVNQRDGNRQWAVEAQPRLRERLGCCAAVCVFFFAGYGALNRLIPIAVCWDFGISLDRETPFVPEFIWPFCLAYAAVIIPSALVPSHRALIRTTVAFLVLISVSFLLFVLVPVTVPRPTFLPDTVAGSLMRRLYLTDRPVCAFPSLHVSTMVLATAALFRVRPLFGWSFLPLAVAASLATLLVKQHVIADVLGGLVLALAVDWLVQSGRLDRLVVNRIKCGRCSDRPLQTGPLAKRTSCEQPDTRDRQ